MQSRFELSLAGLAHFVYDDASSGKATTRVCAVFPDTQQTGLPDAHPVKLFVKAAQVVSGTVPAGPLVRQRVTVEFGWPGGIPTAPELGPVLNVLELRKITADGDTDHGIVDVVPAAGAQAQVLLTHGDWTANLAATWKIPRTLTGSDLMVSLGNTVRVEIPVIDFVKVKLKAFGKAPGDPFDNEVKLVSKAGEPVRVTVAALCKGGVHLPAPGTCDTLDIDDDDFRSHYGLLAFATRQRILIKMQQMGVVKFPVPATTVTICNTDGFEEAHLAYTGADCLPSFGDNRSLKHLDPYLG